MKFISICFHIQKMTNSNMIRTGSGVVELDGGGGGAEGAQDRHERRGGGGDLVMGAGLVLGCSRSCSGTSGKGDLGPHPVGHPPT